MITPRTVLIRHHHTVASPPHLKALRNIVKVPSIEQILPPAHIMLCCQQQSVHCLHVNRLPVCTLCVLHPGRNTVMVDTSDVPCRHRLCIDRDIITSDHSDHPDPVIAPKNGEHVPKELPVDDECILMHIDLISGICMFHRHLVSGCHRRCFPHCNHIQFISVRHMQTVNIRKRLCVLFLIVHTGNHRYFHNRCHPPCFFI